MENPNYRVSSRWSVSTSSTETIVEEGDHALPPKEYVKRRMTYARRFRYIGFASATFAVIVLPLVSLCGLANPFWQWELGSGWQWELGSGLQAPNHIDNVPIWSCQANGYLTGGSWTFLGIDIRFGRMSFAQVKILDMVWNWVAGRGIQFSLAWLTYHVSTSALMRTAEVTHVPYGLFTSLALYSARPGCLWDIGKGLLTIRGLRAKFIMAWLLFSTIYLAAFPSLLDVMSGYEGSIKAQLMILPNKTTLDLTNIDTFKDILWYYSCEKHQMSTDNTTEPLPSGPCPSSADPSSYNFFDTYLNSSWHLYVDSMLYHNASTTSFYTQNPGSYNCVAEQNVYQWGFSGEWVLLVICINGFWVFGLWILWVDTELKSQLTIAGRRMGIYRAIADVSEAMHEDLGSNLCGYSDKELERAVKKQGPVKYYVQKAKGDGGLGKIGLSSRKSDKVQITWGTKFG